jgi:homopolymeric O-antigen transport system permease protein
LRPEPGAYATTEYPDLNRQGDYKMFMSKVSHKLKAAGSDHISIIEPISSWEIVSFRELKEYRDLFFFLVWRDIKVLYAQTVLGFAWALIQPLTQIFIFTIVFGKVAHISTEGIPYLLYSTVAIVPWTYMSQSMIFSSQSLVTGQALLDKIYFPRLIFPITPILAKLVDLAISLLIIMAVVLYYRIMPTWQMLFFPFIVVYMAALAASIGMWLSSMAIRFRDVKYVMPFLIQMMMYSAPIVYSASSIPAKYRLLYSLNPIVGVIEAFRSCILGTPYHAAYIVPGIVVTIVLFITGAMYFKRMERIFVDVI